MDDLNDLFYFVKVVEHGGFAPAGRALNIPKSRLSRRIAALEDQYETRLLQRSTRHFSVTPTGREFYQRCLAMVAQANAARHVIAFQRAAPQGIVRMSCPTALLEYRISCPLAQFMAEYPEVDIRLEATNRRMDVLDDGLDLALRVRFAPLEDSGPQMRVLADSPQRLVASPEFLRSHPFPVFPADLKELPSLDWGAPRDHVWDLTGPGGADLQVRHRPRYITDDMAALRQAALSGLGVVQLPCMVIEDDLQTGALLDAMPGWEPRSGIVHAVLPPGRELPPAVRLLIDYLAAYLKAS